MINKKNEFIFSRTLFTLFLFASWILSYSLQIRNTRDWISCGVNGGGVRIWPASLICWPRIVVRRDTKTYGQIYQNEFLINKIMFLVNQHTWPFWYVLDGDNVCKRLLNNVDKRILTAGRRRHPWRRIVFNILFLLFFQYLEVNKEDNAMWTDTQNKTKLNQWLIRFPDWFIIYPFQIKNHYKIDKIF
jgi:hypothetical protein